MIKNILDELLYIFRIEYIYFKTKEILMKKLLRTKKQKQIFLNLKFKNYLGYKINFNKKPINFNEKIQFRKLYNKDPLYSLCADKYRVRDYVKQKIGEEYLIPLYLVTDKLLLEQWEKLPNSFVAKANHNSGPVQIIKDKSKANPLKIIRHLNSQLKLDYGVLSMEEYYSDIPRKVIVEKLLIDNKHRELIDYKFFCFSGKVKYCQVIQERSYKETIDFYDTNWQKQEFTGLTLGVKKSKNILEKPLNYEKMLQLASKLSKDFDFVRVDFYNIDGKIYFGELTFCPASGFGKFVPEKWNRIFGEMWI